MSLPMPPALATWLLEHFVTRPNKEAVAGDLLEQFSRRRSAAWYWRQVVAAVAFDLWKQWRPVWIAAGTAILWTWAYVLWWPNVSNSLGFQAMTVWSFKQPLWASRIYLIALNEANFLMPLVLALSIYAGVSGRSNVRRMTLGLLVGSAALEISRIGLTLMLLFSPSAVVRLPYLAEFCLALPLFASLLLSLSMVDRQRTSSAVATPLV